MTNLFVRLDKNGIAQFPYSRQQFRSNYPNTSFPSPIPISLLKTYNVYPVYELEKPDFDVLVETLVRDELPEKEIVRYKTKEDVTNPFTKEVKEDEIGKPVYGNDWYIGYTVEKLPVEKAKENIRKERQRILEKTDWMALSDNTMSPEWATYRQKLRDITDQEGFPFSVTWPTKPKN